MKQYDLRVCEVDCNGFPIFTYYDEEFQEIVGNIYYDFGDWQFDANPNYCFDRRDFKIIAEDIDKIEAQYPVTFFNDNPDIRNTYNK